jgi:hypothetical protein
MTFLSPAAALVGLAAVLPLAALALLERRSKGARALLGVEQPQHPAWLVPGAALVAFAGLLALAAAQPALTDRRVTPVRTDAEAFFLLDVSRSMLAGRGDETRLHRARVTALALRREIAEVPAGLASLTDRALPHLYPTPDPETFAETLSRTIEIEHPPPYIGGVRATSLEPLEEFAGPNFFSRRASRRLLVVLTDGESVGVDPALMQLAMAEGTPYELVLVQVWHEADRIRGDRYRPDPASAAELAELASGLDAEAMHGSRLNAARRAVRAAVGHGPTASRIESADTKPLAPYAAALALLPLGVLLRRRNLA